MSREVKRPANDRGGQESPGVSVIVPVFNAAATIGDQLAALASQSEAPTFEVIVVDDGSTDGTCDVVRAAMDRDRHVRLVELPGRRGPNAARNRGVEQSSGDLLLFCDADDVADADWVRHMVEGLKDHDIVGGHLEHNQLNKGAVRAWYRAPSGGLIHKFGFLPYASSASLGIRREVLAAVGGWDEAFVNYTDADLCYRAQLIAGATIGVAPDAVMHYRYRTSRREMARQMRSYGRSAIQIWRRYRTESMPFEPRMRLLKSGAWLLLHLPDLLRSPAHAGRWHRRAASEVGLLTGLLQPKRTAAPPLSRGELPTRAAVIKRTGDALPSEDCPLDEQ